MRRLRIVGAGAWWNTRVEDAETGEPIAGIVGIRLDLAHDKQLVQLDVLAERCQLDLTVESAKVTPVDAIPIVVLKCGTCGGQL